MKTITTILVLFCSINLIYAQKAKPSKEETVKYINDLFSKSSKATYQDGTLTGESVSLDGKTLVIKYKNDRKPEGTFYRKYLGNYKVPLEIKFNDYTYTYGIKGIDVDGIKSDEDAKRLKNALEHLIKIVQSEPDDDPFAN